jgi:hypothetical protein
VGLRCSNKCDIHLNIGQGYTEIRYPPLSWTIEYRNPIFTTVLDNGVQKYKGIYMGKMGGGRLKLLFRSRLFKYNYIWLESAVL